MSELNALPVLLVLNISFELTKLQEFLELLIIFQVHMAGVFGSNADLVNPNDRRFCS